MAFTQVPITGTIKLPNNSAPAAGAIVTFTLNTAITDGVTLISPTPVQAVCAADGTFSVTLPANDDTATTPTGTYYQVTIASASAPFVSLDTFNIIVPKADSAGVNLFALATLINPGSVSPFVSKIVAGTGVTITPTTGIGAVTINASGGGGSGGTLTPVAVNAASSPVAAAVGNLYEIDNTAGPVVINYPSAPADKSQIGVKVTAYSAANAITINRGGSDVFNIAGGATSALLQELDQAKTHQYISATGVWLAVSGDRSLTQEDVRYPAYPASATRYTRPARGASAWVAELPAGGVDIVAEFGVSSGAADNSTAINTALSTLGPLGLKAYLPFPGAGNSYAIQNPIIIGNGTSSTFSTWTASLEGGGMPGGNSTAANGAPTIETKLLWTGGAQADAMIQVIGPLSGWELTNLKVDGGGVQGSMPAYAIHFKSTVRGRMDNVSVQGCQNGIWHDSYSAVSGALAGKVVDDIFNQCRNIAISYTGKAATTSMGLLFDGGANAVSNTCFNLYEGVWFSPPSSSLGGGATNTDIYFKKCDSILIRHTTHDGRTGTDSKHTVTYDWSGVQQWPKGCVIDKADFGNVVSTQFTSTGTPGGSISHNRIINISSANGQPANPVLPWLQWGDNAYTGFASLVAGTVTVSGNAASGVVPGSFIQASRLLLGGSPIGQIGVGTRGTGSFVLESRNADGSLCTTDTSAVLYRVVTDPFF